MVAKITFPKRTVAALNYNENKVKQENADCLHAANSMKNSGEMNFYQKLQLLERSHDLNDSQTKTMHVSLNFDPSEKLSKEKLVKIATEYMQKIGFGDQPYLVYQHRDAGHPHIHIVTSTIRDDGKRISTHNIGRNQSEAARKEIEQKYQLVKAESQKQLLADKILPVKVDKVAYGESETRKAITNVVTAVLQKYKCTSIPELNAVLNQYNVLADKGKEDSRTFRHGGLYYRVLDKDGNKTGVPIKASTINGKPTLKKLESVFEKNKDLKAKLKNDVKAEFQKALSQKPDSLQELIQFLKQQRITTVLRQNAEGRVYGITIVDNNRKVVFNGSELGKDYSIAGLEKIIAFNKSSESETQSPALPQEQVSIPVKKEQPQIKTPKEHKKQLPGREQTLGNESISKSSGENPSHRTGLIDDLMPGKQENDTVPAELKRKRKRRRRRLGL